MTKSTIVSTIPLFAAVLFTVTGFLYTMGKAIIESFRAWQTSRCPGI